MHRMLIASLTGGTGDSSPLTSKDPVLPSTSMSSIDSQEHPLRGAGVQDVMELSRLHTMPASHTGSSAMLPIS